MKPVIKVALISLFAVIVIANCTSEKNESSSTQNKPSSEQKEISSSGKQEAKTQQATNCPIGSPIEGKFYVTTRDIPFRTGPGKNHDQVVNDKASEFMGKTQYRTLYPQMALEGMCQTDNWLQARIVESDGEKVTWETGWVEKKSVTDTPSAERQLGLLWDIDDEKEFSIKEKKMFKSAAINVLKNEPNCTSVYYGDRSVNKKGKYFISCNDKTGDDPFNVWFSPSDVAKGTAIATPKVIAVGAARQACEQAIRQNVTHPSTLDIHNLTGFATKEHSNGRRTIIQVFTVKNTFNLKLKYSARCLVMPDGKVELTITEMQ